MTERVRWRAKHDALALELERMKKDYDDALLNAVNLGKENDELRGRIEELQRQIVRARAEGMKGAAEFLLSAE